MSRKRKLHILCEEQSRNVSCVKDKKENVLGEGSREDTSCEKEGGDTYCVMDKEVTRLV